MAKRSRLQVKTYVLFLFCIFLCSNAAHANGNTPALIPMPQSVIWGEASFDLSACRQIRIANESIRPEAVQLQQKLQLAGFSMEIVLSASGKRGTIFLALGKVHTAQQVNEAYRLSVTKTAIVLTANTTHGVFNGLQTLYQLMVADKEVRGCSIIDYPAFAWHGYMVDVGRNYQ